MRIRTHSRAQLCAATHIQLIQRSKIQTNNCNHHRQVRFTIKDNHERHGIPLRLAMWLFALVLTTDIQQVTCRCVCVHVRACTSGYRPPPHSLAESVFSSSLNLFPFVCCVTELEERDGLQYSPSQTTTTNHPLNNALLYVPTHVGNNLHFRTVGMRGLGRKMNGGGLVVSRGEFRNGSPLSFLLHSQCQIVLQPA